MLWSLRNAKRDTEVFGKILLHEKARIRKHRDNSNFFAEKQRCLSGILPDGFEENKATIAPKFSDSSGPLRRSEPSVPCTIAEEIRSVAGVCLNPGKVEYTKPVSVSCVRSSEGNGFSEWKGFQFCRSLCCRN